MRSIETVTVAPYETQLTTVTRVKLELGITGSGSDPILDAKIDEASSDIEAHLSRTLSRATVTATIWGEPGYSEELSLSRFPIVSVASVLVDGDTIDASQYRIDQDAGLIYRLDTSGYPMAWIWNKAIVISYIGGFLMPDESGRTLPPALEAAAVELVQSFWFSRGRDTMVRAETVDGVASTTYWVGAVGDDGDLPPGVTEKIARFRRAAY